MDASVEAVGVEDLADLAAVVTDVIVLSEPLDRDLGGLGAEQRNRPQDRELGVGETGAVRVEDP